MKRFIGIIAILLFFCSLTSAKAKYSDYVKKGGKLVKTSSTTTYKLMETYPGSTVGVYLVGTNTLATIYSDSSGTLKTNPFTSDSNAYYEFYANNGRYDIKFSGIGISIPFTKADVVITDNITTYTCIGTDDTTGILSAINSLGPITDNIIQLEGTCVLGSQLLLQGKRGIVIQGRTRLGNGGGGNQVKIRWNGNTTASVIKLDSCQGMTIRWLGFDIINGKNTNSFIDIDGSGFGGTISTANDVYENAFNWSNTTNANIKAVSISATSITNNESMKVYRNVSFGAANIRTVDTGNITIGTANLNIQGANLTSNDIGSRIRIGNVGSSGNTLDTIIVSVTDANNCVINTNAIATAQNARVHIGRAWGTGIYVGPSGNALHQEFLENDFINVNYGIYFAWGSGIVDTVRGYGNDTDVYIQKVLAEGVRIGNINTENSVQRIVITDTPDAPITIYSQRGTNNNQLTEGFYQLRGRVVFRDSSVDYLPPNFGKIINEGNPSALALELERIQFPSISLEEIGVSSLSIYDQWSISHCYGINGVGYGTIVSHKADNAATDYSITSSNNSIMSAIGVAKYATFITGGYESTDIDSLKFGNGELAIGGVFQPSPPTILKIGNHTGNVSYSFAILAADNIGNRSMHSYSGNISGVNATLDINHSLKISWTAIPNADHYELYEIQPGNAVSGRLVAASILTNSYSLTTNPVGAFAVFSTLTPTFNESGLIKVSSRILYPISLTFTNLDTTPSVAKGRNFIFSNSAPTTISNFTNMLNGQEVFVTTTNSNTTINFSSGFFKGNGGVDLVLTVNDSLLCQKVGGSNIYCRK